MKELEKITIDNKNEFKNFEFEFQKHIQMDYGFDSEKIYSRKIQIKKGPNNRIEIFLTKKITFDIDFDFKKIYVWNKDIMLISKEISAIELTLNRKNEKISVIKIIP